MPKPIRLSLMLLVLTGLAFAFANPALAQELSPNETVDFSGLLPAALTLLLPVGLILLISSAVPEPQAPAMAINLLMAWGVATLAYFAIGFAFQFGGVAQVTPNPDLRGLYWEWYPLDQSVDAEIARLWGVIALRGWFLTGEAATPGALRLFLSHVSLIGAAAMIPAGALPTRFQGVTSMLVALLTGSLIYPLAGNWLWGGGWLASLGAGLGLGHGLVDFGGSSLIFLTGGVISLVALLVFRPASEQESEIAEVVVTTGLESRLTVYEEATDSPEEILSATPMPSAYLPILSLLGAGLMALGWFGLSSGLHAPTALNFSSAQAAVGGLLAALSAALTSAGYSWFTTRELNPLMTSRGFVAGLIVAMAGAPFIPIWLVIVVALVMGLLLPSLIYFFNQGLRLADELGTVATYGVSAIVSLLLVAFFADGRAGQGWNGLDLTNYLGVEGQGVSGLVVGAGLAADWPGQFQAQLLGLGAISIWAMVVSVLLFQTIKAVTTAWARAGLELADSTLGEPVPVTPSNPGGSAPVEEPEAEELKPESVKREA